MNYETTAKLIMAVMILFFVATGILFSLPVNAGTDWACKNGAPTLDSVIGRLEKNPNRTWFNIEASGEYQLLFVIIETGQAGVTVFIKKCALSGFTIPVEPIVEIFDLDFRQVFPVLKKGSF